MVTPVALTDYAANSREDDKLHDSILLTRSLKYTLWQPSGSNFYLL